MGLEPILFGIRSNYANLRGLDGRSRRFILGLSCFCSSCGCCCRSISQFLNLCQQFLVLLPKCRHFRSQFVVFGTRLLNLLLLCSARLSQVFLIVTTE
ncbi:hypothetical protein PFISCL1PPCAC_28867 [Pristionchus fissidentatus]|uniref:Uncharacterized protein n=1 Tax=Pristionchus fissidentatus TaxID=1538716 RepID=A0AAV5WH45_9BILA|nr:hypothetical protein PFISCL1PPCAC_20559 [Pristionchus fissidentatus]GMT37570.1 hypothetical protein PFISCL1PPCAC_28867 [Pristionchus fissidentatus]